MADMTEAQMVEMAAAMSKEANGVWVMDVMVREDGFAMVLSALAGNEASIRQARIMQSAVPYFEEHPPLCVPCGKELTISGVAAMVAFTPHGDASGTVLMAICDDCRPTGGDALLAMGDEVGRQLFPDFRKVALHEGVGHG